VNGLTARGRRAASLLAAVILTILIPVPAQAAGTIRDTPPSPDIRVGPITANGSGCAVNKAPARTVADDDNGGFRASFPDFTARIGPGVPAVERLRSCILNVPVDAAKAGYRYAVSEVDLGGYAALAAGVTGDQRTSIFFQGEPVTGVLSRRFTGPADRDWQVTDQVPVDARIWSRCDADRNLNLILNLAVSSRGVATTTSLLSMTASDDPAAVHVRFAWQPC
jgi:hypothetical protein